MSTLDLKLITIEEVVFSDAAEKVTIPTVAGEITVLPQHIPLVSQLRPGIVTVHGENGQKKFQVTGGVLEVRKNSHVIILADSATRL